MKKKIIILSAIMALLIGCSACSKPMGPITLTEDNKVFLSENYSDVSDVINQDMENNLTAIDEVYKMVNAYRKDNNIKPLEFNQTLTMLATIRAQEIADSGKFSHHRPNNKGYFSSIFKEYGITEGSVGENLAQSYKTAEEAVNAWKNSETHNSCMLNSKWRYTGIGVAQAENGSYIWVQEFSEK